MSFFSTFIGSLFDDVEWTDSQSEEFSGNALSDLLPWRVFDPEDQLYYFTHGVGFIMEAAPAIGGAETADNIRSVMQSNFPSNGSLQVINWAGPGFDPELKDWLYARKTSTGVVQEMVTQRAKHLRDRRFGDGHESTRSFPMLRKLYIAGWIEGETDLQAIAALKTLRGSIKGCFPSGDDTRNVPADTFVQLILELLHAARGEDGSSQTTRYDEHTPLNLQYAGSTLQVRSGSVQLAGEPKMSVATSTVVKYPNEWMFGLGDNLLGEAMRVMDRPRGPVLTSLVIKAIAPQKASSMMLGKRAKNEHADGKFSKFIPSFGEKKKEDEDLANLLNAGERLFETIYTVSTYALGGDVEAKQAATEVATIYRRQNIQLSTDRYMQMPLFLNALPFSMSNASMGNFSKLMRMRLLKGEAAASVLPLHGEWSGNIGGAGMMLLGRRGQIMNFSNFSSSGNYNVSVVGKSGAGKSVLMQEIVVTTISTGGRVLVIDDGYSFKTTAELLGGRHIAFDGKRENKLNPFSILDAHAMGQDEYRADAVQLLTRIIATMAELSDHVEGRVLEVEEGYIAVAVGTVWDEKGASGEVSDVCELLKVVAKKDERLKDVIGKIEQYCEGGIFGNYFTGQANISLDAALTVVELSDVKSQRGLQAVLLQIIMFLGTELMFKTPRDEQTAIVVDEAWDLLQGSGTAKFIEGVARRARKYTGALITGTQSVSDYEVNPAAKVAWDNSDFRIFMAQKPDSIDRNDNWSAPIKTQLKSLTSVPGQFAELAIQTPEGFAFGRLVLDPFSLAVYSSKGSTVKKIEQLKDSGLTTVQSIRKLVEMGEVS